MRSLARLIGPLLLGLFVAIVFSVATEGASYKTMFNGVLYTWPSSHGAAILKTNGSGTLTWDGAAGVPSVPTGVVLFTDAASCPTGWAAYGSDGEYFVGATANIEGQVGTVLGHIESRATGVHTHTHSESLSVSVSAHGHAVGDVGHRHYGEDGFGSDDLVGEGGTGKLGSGSRGARLDSANVAGSISVNSVDTNVGISSASATVTDYSGTAGTNAPYIQLRGCRKS